MDSGLRAFADFFVAGGTLPADVPSYVTRPADNELFNLALAGKFCYVLTARQMGKSSLMIRTASRLQAEGVRTAIIDLTQMGLSTADTWYLDLLTELANELRLTTSPEAWWQKRANLGPVRRFTNFLREVVLTEIEGKIAIFIDEIDSTLNLDFRDDFFAAIRAVYNVRAQNLEFNRLTFILLGVASPSDLIEDRTRTPFNIGQGIDLPDFSREDAVALQPGLEAIYPGQGQAILNRIFYWTNGHPYLTQKLCLAVAETNERSWSDERLDALVAKLFLSEKGRKDTNLQFIQDRVKASLQQRELLILYRQVYEEKETPENEQSLNQNQLKLYGLVRAEHGLLKVRNEIYYQVFNLDWVEANIPSDWISYLGKYQIIERLGGGEIVQVYKAVHLSLARHVAMKVIHLHRLTGVEKLNEFVERLKREVAVAAGLRHPNIVQVHDFDRVGDVYYIVTDFIEGPSLKAELKKRQRQGQSFNLAEIARIFEALASALDYAHAQGVVHCDLKPANIMFTPDQGVMLTDFGIAHLMEAFYETISDTTIGTPAYMSPEQAWGKQVDGRSDIYSLGVILYEMVTGHVPFAGKNKRAILSQHVSEPVPPLRAINRDTPEAMEQVILKALNKNPADRYQTAGALAQALAKAIRKPRGAVIGIDLGTTKSVMAHLDDTGRPQTIKVLDGKQSMPSVVGFSEDGKRLVGEEAKAQAIMYPKNTIFSIKRFMGRLYADEDVQEDIRMVPYEVTEAENGEAAVWLNGKAYSPIEISAFILETLKHEAEEQMGEITHAVITVPAYFGQRQREATRDAGRLAGLKVIGVLPEPTAAALAYGIDILSSEDKIILVYDLGGGTFDVTVILVSGGVFVDLAKTGDNHLGGDNFDQEIIKYIIEQTRRRQGVDLQHNREALQKLKQAAEKAKITLSSRRGQARITIPAIAQDERGRWIDIQLSLTQQEYEDMIRPYIKRTIELVHQALREADCLVEDIDHILLVGGSTLTPLVAESLRAEFGDEKILRGVNPMECVAAGAAIQGGYQLEKITKQPELLGSQSKDDKIDEAKLEKECPSCGRLNNLEREECRYCGYRFKEIITQETTAKPLGIQTEGDKMQVIIQKNTLYPTDKPFTQYFHTNRPNQDFVRIPVYEGFEEVATQNEYLGVAQGKLPEGLPNNTEVAVSFSLDTDGIIFVTMELPDHPGVKIEAKIKMGEARSEQARSMARAGQAGAPPPLRGWQEEAQGTLDIARFTLGRGRRYIEPQINSQLQELGFELQQAIADDNEALGRQKKVELEEAVNELGFVTLLVFAEALAEASDTDVSSNERRRLANLVTEAQQALKNGDNGLLRSVLSKLNSLVMEIMDRIRPSGRDVGRDNLFSDLLRGGSSD